MDVSGPVLINSGYIKQLENRIKVLEINEKIIVKSLNTYITNTRNQ